jgi:hypothetical protein
MYYPELGLNVSPAAQSVYGVQSPYDLAHTASLTGEVQFWAQVDDL